MRETRKYLLNAAALVLPSLAFSALVVFILHAAIPRFKEYESKRIESLSKETSDSLKKGGIESDFVWEYGKGVIEGDEKFAALFPKSMTWKQWQPREGTKRAEKMWGYLELEGTKNILGGGQRIIWARDKKLVRGKICEIGELNYALLFWLAGGGAIFIVVGLSLFAALKLVIYSKSRDEFMMATAHDLNMPLMGLRFTIGKNDDEAKNLCERIFRLAENIREFMHMGGRKIFKLAEVDLFKAYLEAYKIFELDFQDVYDGKDVEVSGDKELVVKADETALVQIFWNILANELKYASQYGKVKVEIKKYEKLAHIAISDEGPGMTKHEMRRAFRRYWRGAKGFSKGGFGIGLCVARQFAVGMGGGLCAKPSKEGGTTFCLTLPLANAAKI